MTGGATDDPAETDCPVCGSSRTVRRKVTEHTACGYIRPTDLFERQNGCPKCDTDIKRRDEFEEIGLLWTCFDCGHTFDARSDSTTPADGSENRSGPTSLNRSARDQLQSVVTVAVVVLVISTAVVGAVGSSSLMPDGGDATQPARWDDYQSIVIFRNDDLQPYYRTQTMKKVDSIFVNQSVPVTQGVIPAPHGQQIRPDSEFCDYLQQRQVNHPELFEWALHGYSHQMKTNFHGGSEFGGIPYQKQHRWIQQGTNLIEQCVGERPTTFVPPRNTYDNATLRALAEENYTAVSGGSWFTETYYEEKRTFTAHDLTVTHIPSTQPILKSWSSTTAPHYSERALERKFDAAYRNGSMYVQMIHYPTFTTQEKREDLRGLINHMQSRDEVKFMTVGEFAEKYQRGWIEKTEEGWRVKERPDDGEVTFSERVDQIVTTAERYVDRALPGVAAPTARVRNTGAAASVAPPPTAAGVTT